MGRGASLWKALHPHWMLELPPSMAATHSKNIGEQGGITLLFGSLGSEVA